MSRTFSTNCGSVDSLNVSVRCGCKQKACQIRWTDDADTPAAFAMPRVLQCVALRRCFANRSRHVLTVWRVTPTINQSIDRKSVRQLQNNQKKSGLSTKTIAQYAV